VRRGDLVTVALPGDYGKPRPALVIQSDEFHDLASVTVLRLTSDLNNWPTFRISVEPTKENGLRATSQVMIDKPAALPRAKVGRVFGRLGEDALRAVDQALLAFLGLGD
jgi:mRNA interferase MazF